MLLKKKKKKEKVNNTCLVWLQDRTSGSAMLPDSYKNSRSRFFSLPLLLLLLFYYY